RQLREMGGTTYACHAEALAKAGVVPLICRYNKLEPKAPGPFFQRNSGCKLISSGRTSKPTDRSKYETPSRLSIVSFRLRANSSMYSLYDSSASLPSAKFSANASS